MKIFTKSLMMNIENVLKTSGQTEAYSPQKLVESLVYSGLNKNEAQKIVDQVSNKIQGPTTSQELSKAVYKLLKKENKRIASHYSLTKSIHALGPEGHIFEKFVCAIFTAMEYKAVTGHKAKGKCVEHEIDVKAIHPSGNIYCECKFHNKVGTKNDLKTALYIQARSEDLKANPEHNLKEFWFITNTKFTQEAIAYASCAGLKLLGANYPHTNALTDLAIRYKIFPVFCLTTLAHKVAKALVNKKIYFVHQLNENINVLKSFGVSDEILPIIENETRQLLRK